MTGMSARQFERLISRKMLQKITHEVEGGIMRKLSQSLPKKSDASMPIVPGIAAMDFRVESAPDHELSYSRFNSGYRWTTFYMGQSLSIRWDCPYCGAEHALTVKTCDCCGARRRREYVH